MPDDGSACPGNHSNKMLRGRFKRALILDLAAGDEIYEALAPSTAFRFRV